MTKLNTDNLQRLHAIMAGNGNPYGVLTPTRKRLLRALHDNVAISEIATTLGMTASDIQDELTPLITAHLVMRHGEHYQPAFFIASATETQRVTEHAHDTGRMLANRLLAQWDEIESTYQQLVISRDWAFSDLAFLLVGDRILDIGLLDAFARDGKLMQPAPARPSPDSPKARYYFWMIEGAEDQLGRYGQRATPLPWENWYLLTFGQYRLNGRSNQAREALESKAHDALEENQVNHLRTLAELLNIPAFDQEDTHRWSKYVQSSADDLMRIYRNRGGSMRQLYTTLHASRYAPYGFSEFFCWYDHVAYAHALDVLASANVLSIPEQRFIAALWYEQPEANNF